jgi:ABC-type multidrug transport system fused ATPase/permease subunit
MINAIVRSPAKFFDSTPSGVLTNKFSNDLGIIDNSLIVALFDAVEGPIAILVAIFNICQIDYYLIAPAVIITIFSVFFFIYARPGIILCKLLDLQNKN